MKKNIGDNMTHINPAAPVLVTGASGYIAGWIVKYLLEAGRTVHATVRDPSKKSAVAHLEAIAAKAPGTLKLFRADLLAQGSFDEATQGCELVIHTASPFIIKGFTDAYEALVRPAVEGTRNVLDSVNKSASVKRVVLTSSVASVFGDNCDAKGGVLTEKDWNTTSSVNHQPYSFSKVEAEKEAWRMHAAQASKRWDLVCVNPSLVMGPSLTKQTQSTSISTMLDLGRGKLKTGVPKLEFGLVDVRDVAKAHILAGDSPDAEGRYIINEASYSLLDMANLLRQDFSQYPLPSTTVPKGLVWLLGPILSGVSRDFVAKNVGHSISLDNTRSRSQLRLKYLPMQQTLSEMFTQLVDDGLIKRR
jgi:nucleoside-diphosphate-sugar epimerase